MSDIESLSDEIQADDSLIDTELPIAEPGAQVHNCDVLRLVCRSKRNRDCLSS